MKLPPGIFLILKLSVVLAAVSLMALWFAPLGMLEAMVLVLLLSLSWWQLLRGSVELEEPRPLEEGNVVYLDEYRRRKTPPPAVSSEGTGLVQVYESQFLHEADLTASYLEYHGVRTHVFNRHNASILIHPLGEMTVRVLVHEDDAEQALRLLSRRNQTPEGSFTA